MSRADLIADAAARAPYLARLLGRDSSRLSRVAADPYLTRAKPASVQVEELAAALATIGDDSAGLARELRRYRADELVRCGVRELDLEKPMEVGEELAHLADACLDAAIDHHRRLLEAVHGEAIHQRADGSWHRAELVVIAMGKHGGEELNFASDIDVIYVYSSDAGPDDPDKTTLHGFFSELCRRVTAALGEVTDEDVVFRVDLRLRPEGSRGAIANSLPSLERYYENWGRPWERQAWLKARPCAGSLALGAEVMETMRPFVYPRSTSVDVIAEVTALNRQIKAEQKTGGINQGFDLKNGVGGIREIEFFVQALQLLWSPTRAQLRNRSTIGALDQLLFAGLVSEAERKSLGSAYRFMRHVEHMLQLDSGRQTQRLPGDEDALGEFARRLDFDDAAAFLAVLDRHSSIVAEIFASLSDGDDDDDPQLGEVRALLAGTLSAEREVQLFASLGFTEPQEAVTRLERARRLASSPLGQAASGAGARVAPRLLLEVAHSPDPDQAFHYISDLAARRTSLASVWRIMDDNPAVIRLLASLFGTSVFLSRHFVSHPELLDQLLLAGNAAAHVSPERLAIAFAARLAEADADDEEATWDALAEAKISQQLRIGLADIAGDLSALEVCTELSIVADECLCRAYALTSLGMRERYGWPKTPEGNDVEFSVLALGKLGGRELGYASDLDVVFVFSEDGVSDGQRSLDATTFFTRLAQRLMRSLHALHRGGRLYELDTRLRPLGTKGLLVSSLPAWRNYHKSDHSDARPDDQRNKHRNTQRNKARLWERQALIKLRPVAGDATLGALIAGETLDVVYRHGQDTVEIARGLFEMRQRIESELSGGRLDLKVGRGGLVDIEFTAQFLQLAHGAAHPRMRVAETVTALDVAAELGLADADACNLLADGYRYLRFIEHRMRIVHDRSVATLPEGGIELDKLARRAGYARAQALTEAFEKWRASIRDAFRQIVGPPA